MSGRSKASKEMTDDGDLTDDPALKPLPIRESPLQGKKALVVGIANKDSIAYGCARAFRAWAPTCRSPTSTKRRNSTRPNWRWRSMSKSRSICRATCAPGQLEAVFDTIRRDWGRLDILLHSIAYAPREDLHGRVTDCSLAGFRETMDISVHSLIRMTALAEPLMTDGGVIFTMSYFGGEKVVPHYGIMGPAKAALETAALHGRRARREGHRVNVISPGPVLTRAASGIDRFDELLDKTKQRAPTRMLVDAG